MRPVVELLPLWTTEPSQLGSIEDAAQVGPGSRSVTRSMHQSGAFSLQKGASLRLIDLTEPLMSFHLGY